MDKFSSRPATKEEIGRDFAENAIYCAQELNDWKPILGRLRHDVELTRAERDLIADKLEGKFKAKRGPKPIHSPLIYIQWLRETELKKTQADHAYDSVAKELSMTRRQVISIVKQYNTSFMRKVFLDYIRSDTEA